MTAGYVDYVPPGFHGANVTAVLFHPKLPNSRLEVSAHNEREARRQAWRYAISENLPGFIIKTKPPKGPMP